MEACRAGRAQAEERAVDAESQVLRLHCELQALRTALLGGVDSSTTAPPPPPVKKTASCCIHSGSFITACCLAVVRAPCRLLRLCPPRGKRAKICPFQNASGTGKDPGSCQTPG